MSFQTQPREIILFQLSYLDYKTLVNFSRTNKYHFDLVQNWKSTKEKRKQWVHDLLFSKIYDALTLKCDFFQTSNTSLEYNKNNILYQVYLSNFRDYFHYRRNLEKARFNRSVDKYINDAINQSFILKFYNPYLWIPMYKSLFFYFKNLPGVMVTPSYPYQIVHIDTSKFI